MTWNVKIRFTRELVILAIFGILFVSSIQITNAQHHHHSVVDFNGDNLTDYVVVRNVGGGPGGQIRWFYNLSSGGSTVAKDWGIATDFFVTEDFDGDNKDDLVAYRPGAAPNAAFYVLKSSDQTAIVEPFGQTGDDPTVLDDYNNDGKGDFAVYRAGANAGDPSTWFYRTTPGGPVNYVSWGQNGDFPAPGDYDGNGSADFVVQRNNGGGQAAFWRRFNSGATDVVIFGTPTDAIVPGDYDGDGSIDIAVVRNGGGQMLWFWRQSSNGVIIGPIAWGVWATDYTTQGIFPPFGGGRCNPAVWRPSPNPNESAFYVLNQVDGAVTIFAMGQQGDYPVANWNTH